MTILVTGGAGYIGGHFIYQLNQSGQHKIIVVDNFSSSKNNIITDERITYVDLDIKDESGLRKIFADNPVDLVVHFAALASVPDSVTAPRDYYHNNIIGGLNLLNAMVDFGVKKIIFSSSAAVYGEPQAEVLTEDHPKKPTNPYGRTKLIFEQILADYHVAYGINSVSFRYFSASGVNLDSGLGEYHLPETHVIPMIMETALGRRNCFHIYGHDYETPDGSGIRDFIHVDDIADAHLKAITLLNNEPSVVRAYNIGSNHGFSVLDLVRTTEKIIDNKVNYDFQPRRDGDVSRLVASHDLLKRDLGWEPVNSSIDNILNSAYQFFKHKQ